MGITLPYLTLGSIRPADMAPPLPDMDCVTFHSLISRLGVRVRHPDIPPALGRLRREA